MDALTEAALIDLTFNPTEPRDSLLDALAIDLAFDPAERRDSKGRWTDGGASEGFDVAKIKAAAAKSGVDVNSLMALLDPDDLSYSAPKKPTYAEESAEMDWANMDASGGLPSDKASMRQEHKAQIEAQFWHDNIDGESPEDDQYAASLWEQYQNPSIYSDINKTLRDEKQVEGGPTPEQLQKAAKDMFAKAGVTIKKPMTVYRALRSKRGDGASRDWAKELQPGTVFSDKGIISTTAHGRFAQGWLGLSPKGEQKGIEDPSDVIVEIRLPKGQRIVGGSTQFIETMLPPGTSFKITSSEKRRAEAPRNPLGDYAMDPFDYTHVVAEVVTDHG
jgi:hypothetical protein